MERANQVLRRGSIRIRSLKTGHSDLNMIISDIQGVRSSCKKFTNAQKILVDDLSKWATHENNLALQETFHYLSDLSDMWYEAQRQFIGNIKQLQLAFESIRESEYHVDKAKAHLTSTVELEEKLKKEKKKVPPSEIWDHKKKINHAEACTAAAQQEVSKKKKENEIFKVKKVKESLTVVSDFYLQLAYKSSVIFLAHSKIVDCIPEMNEAQSENVRFTGSAASRRAIVEAKSNINNYKKHSMNTSAPPPYSSHPVDSSGSPIGVGSSNLMPVEENDRRYYEIPVPNQYHELGDQIYINLVGAVGGVSLNLPNALPYE